MPLTEKAQKIQEEVFHHHPLSSYIDVQYAPGYQEKWMNAELYGIVLDEEWSRLRTLLRREDGGRIAIVHVKAQHMLYADGTPGPEYETRLAEALHVGKELVARGMKVIYVTSGAVHAGCDTVTLAEAGRRWLVDRGVDPEEITMHTTLKNGNDEDYQVAEMVETDREISEIHVICSNGQMMRSMLCFMSKGWTPFFHPVTYLGLNSSEFDADDSGSAWTMDALRPHQSVIAELQGKGFGVSPFFEGSDAIRAAEQAAIQRHEEEIRNPAGKQN